MKKRNTKNIIIYMSALILLFLLAGCGEEKELAMQVATAPEVVVPDDTGEETETEPEEEAEEELVDPFFHETSEVTYESLMSCFTAEYLLSVSGYVRKDQTFSNYGDGSQSDYSAEYAWYNGYLAEHSVCDRNSGASYEETWTNYDGHSIVIYGSDETGEGLVHTVYPKLSFYQQGGVPLVTDFSSMTTPVLTSTEPLENGLYQTMVEYRSGNTLYALGIYDYDPVNVILSSYEEILYYGADEACARELGTVSISNDIVVDFDPASIFGYCATVDIAYDGAVYTVETCSSENLIFTDIYSTTGVLDYVTDKDGQLVYSGYDRAYLGYIDRDTSFTVETIWLESYPEEPMQPSVTVGIDGFFLMGTWMDSLTQPSYMVTIDENLSFTCDRLAEDGSVINTYIGSVLTGNFVNEDSNTFDYMELALRLSDDDFFDGWSTLGDFCIAEAVRAEDHSELHLVPADEVDSLFRIYYSISSPVWYKAEDVASE